MTDVDDKKVAVCAHPFIRKGYYLGLEPDLYVCVACGEKRLPQHWEQFERRRVPSQGMFTHFASAKP
jgi:hypothetical protein